jgi:hypothetical protein
MMRVPPRGFEANSETSLLLNELDELKSSSAAQSGAILAENLSFEKLVAAILKLSPKNRERIAAVLLQARQESDGSDPGTPSEMQSRAQVR